MWSSPEYTQTYRKLVYIPSKCKRKNVITKLIYNFFKITCSIIVLLICEPSLIGMELTFFTAGGCRVAVFWVCDWTVLITHQRFYYGWTVKHQDLFFPCSATPASKPGDRGGSTASTTDQRDTPYYNIVLSNKCSRKGGRRGVTLDMAVFVFPGNSCVCWGLVSQKWAKHLTADGKP